MVTLGAPHFVTASILLYGGLAVWTFLGVGIQPALGEGIFHPVLERTSPVALLQELPPGLAPSVVVIPEPSKSIFLFRNRSVGFASARPRLPSRPFLRAAGQPVVALSAQGAEGVAAGGADGAGAVLLHQDGGGARVARAVRHVRHAVQAGLQQEAVIAPKQLLANQLLDLHGRGFAAAIGLGAFEAVDGPVLDQDLEVPACAFGAVHMLALPEAEAVRAQLLREADSAVEQLVVELLVTLGSVEVQELEQEFRIRVSPRGGPWAMQPRPRAVIRPFLVGPCVVTVPLRREF